MLKPCDRWAERLSAFLDNELNDRDRQAIADHLRDCPACRAAAEVYRCDRQDTAAALTARTASEGFAARVMGQIAVTTIERGSEIAEEQAPKTPKTPIAGTVPGFNGLLKRRPHFSLIEILVVVGIVCALGSVMFPVFSKPREKARQNTCLNNQRQIVVAIQMWAQDHDQQLPSADTWLDNLGLDRGVLIDPTAGKDLNPAYAYNRSIAGRKITEIASAPDLTIVTFDARNGIPEYRHNGGLFMSYLDGHVAYSGNESREKTSVAQMDQPAAPRAVEKRSSQIPTITPPEKNYGLADKLQIAYTANVAFESGDVQGAMEGTELLFRQHDGFVLTSDYQRNTPDGKATATVSGRVPSAQLGELLVGLDKLGTLVSRTVNGEDLTAKHLEQLGTLEDLRGSQSNLEQIGTKAHKTGDSLTVEDRRDKSARGASGVRVEEYKLKSRVTLAEITVQIIGKPAPVPATPPVNPVSSSFLNSAHALAVFGQWLLTFIIIPLGVWLPLWGPVLGITLYVRRRRR